MKIHEIENLSFGELKSRGAELVEAVKGMPIEEVAKRYVQARTDAKHRDEKLGDQVKTLEALRTGLDAMQKRAEAVEREVELAKQETTAIRKKAKGEVADLMATSEAFAKSAGDDAVAFKSQISDLTESLTDEKARSGRLKARADRFATAVSGSYKLLHDAMSLQANDDANQGE